VFSDAQIRRADRGGVLSAYERWPSLAKEGLAVRFAPPRPESNRAFMMGMGGSAAAGDILSGWLAGREGVEVDVLKGSVPSVGMKGSLAIACSVSGNTEETVQMLRAAVAGGAAPLAISGEGKLSEAARSLGVPCIRVPAAVAQRLMLPFIVYSALSVLNRSFGLGCEAEAEESVESLEAEWKEVAPSAPEPANGAKALALSLMAKTPAIYADRVAAGVGVRFKNVLNENSKRHAHFDAVPEAFHNEIESWEDQGGDFLPVFLRHSSESPRDSARLDAMVELLEGAGWSPVTVRGRGESRFSQLMSMAYRLDMASYYLAVRLGRDPLPTRLLDRLKFTDRLPDAH
jgi:glucose/mannose-6-phosphate isomerase